MLVIKTEDTILLHHLQYLTMHPLSRDQPTRGSTILGIQPSNPTTHPLTRGINSLLYTTLLGLSITTLALGYTWSIIQPLVVWFRFSSHSNILNLNPSQVVIINR